jgi:drug/metabolite transporter (DMT)-like permease
VPRCPPAFPCSAPHAARGAVQFAAAALATGLGAALFGDTRVEWTGEFVFAPLWLVLVLSLGAVSLLHLLIRRGAASRVAGLFFLAPPCTAPIAWPLFGETLGPAALLSMALTAAGVALASRGGGPVAGAPTRTASGRTRRFGRRTAKVCFFPVNPRKPPVGFRPIMATPRPMRS